MLLVVSCQIVRIEQVGSVCLLRFLPCSGQLSQSFTSAVVRQSFAKCSSKLNYVSLSAAFCCRQDSREYLHFL